MENLLIKKNYENLDKIVKTTTSLNKLYDKLYTLEINNKKNTQEYQQILKYINIVLEIEEKQYKDYFSNIDLIIYTINYLLTNQLSDEILITTDNIINQNYKNKVLQRIFNNFINILSKDENFLLDALTDQARDVLENEYDDEFDDDEFDDDEFDDDEFDDDEFDDDEFDDDEFDDDEFDDDEFDDYEYEDHKFINKEKLENINKDLHINAELQHAIDKDILINILNFLNNQINNTNDNNLKDKLIKLKYYISFINKDIESELLRSDFNITKPNILISDCVASFYNFNSDALQVKKDLSSTDIIKDQIEKLLNQSDLEFNNQKQQINALLRGYLIRSNLLLISDETFENLNYQFHKFIEDPEYQKQLYDNKIGENIIIQIFNQSVNDRSNRLNKRNKT